MITPEEYSRMKSCSLTDGARVGVVWAASFACMIAGFSDTLWSFASMIIAMASPFYALSRMRTFRRRELGDSMGFRQALGYAIMMLICATLMFAGIQLVYFQFMDHGYFIERYGALLRSPDMAATVGSYGLTAQDIESTIKVISEMRPVEVVIQFLAGNVLLSALLSLPLALFAKKSGGHGIRGGEGGGSPR